MTQSPQIRLLSKKQINSDLICYTCRPGTRQLTVLSHINYTDLGMICAMARAFPELVKGLTFVSQSPGVYIPRLETELFSLSLGGRAE